MTHAPACICTPGVNPQRYLSGFQWDEFKWRRGELVAQFQGQTVLIGVDDMDVFKGIELKLQVRLSARYSYCRRGPLPCRTWCAVRQMVSVWVCEWRSLAGLAVAQHVCGLGLCVPARH